jgi:hypothetical protein
MCPAADEEPAEIVKNPLLKRINKDVIKLLHGEVAAKLVRNALIDL